MRNHKALVKDIFLESTLGVVTQTIGAGDHTITNLEASDTTAYLDHLTGDISPRNERILYPGEDEIASGLDAPVDWVDCDRVVFDDNLVLLWRRVGGLFDFKRVGFSGG